MRKGDGRSEEGSGRGNCCVCVVGCLGFLVLPLFWVALSVPCFFLPFVNLCYDKKIVFAPSLLSDLLQQTQQCLDLYLLI